MQLTAQRLFGMLMVLFLGVSVLSAQGVETEDVIRHPQGLERAGVYGLRQIDPNLDGQGVKISVISRSYTYSPENVPGNDYQPNLEHHCLQDKPVSLVNIQGIPSAMAISPHSTNVCSILFGHDTQAYSPTLGAFTYEGVVPGAEAEVCEFVHFYTERVLVQKDLLADVVTLSCGKDEAWWTRSLENRVNDDGVLVVASGGNGLEAEQTLIYPGAAANLIGVGVVASVRTTDPVTNSRYFTLVYPERSSCGPADDGRCKPDIVSPGNCLVASAVDPNAYEFAGDWSSFAAPVVAGVTGQLVQKARQTPGLEVVASPESGGRVIKAILMNSAHKLPFWHKGQIAFDDDHHVPLDYAQGAGMVDALAAYEQLMAGRQEPGPVATRGWDLGELERGGDVAKAYQFHISEPEEQTITCTVVWNRHYLDPYDMNSVSASDIRLELWARESDSGGQLVLLDYSDSTIDNVEHIFFKTRSGYQDYEIVVILNEGEDSAEQPNMEHFALAWDVSTLAEEDNIHWYDLNGDGIVNAADSALLMHYQKEQAQADGYALGDINSDGVIDSTDLRMIRQNNLRQAPWYIP
ncbi:S8 family serine peptidase [Planctomycetota bacterium]